MGKQTTARFSPKAPRSSDLQDDAPIIIRNGPGCLPDSLTKQRAKLGEGCPARPLRGRAPDYGRKGLFGDSPTCSGIGIAFPPGMWYCVAVEAAQYNTD